MGTEIHATRADDWRVYGNNLGAETYHMGGQFADARRLMLSAWEAWTSGEPEPAEIIHELLSTWWAMAMMIGIEEIGPALEEVVGPVLQEVVANIEQRSSGEGGGEE
jgi:hypothetical protein